jgi:hypothetical protein
MLRPCGYVCTIGMLPIWRKANMFVGAKHDRNQYGIITNNLYAVMLRPLQNPDAPRGAFKPKKPGFLVSLMAPIADFGKN